MRFWYQSSLSLYLLFMSIFLFSSNIQAQTGNFDILLPEMEIAPLEPSPGDIVSIIIKNVNSTMNIIGRMGEEPLNFFPLGDGFFGSLIGIDMTEKAKSKAIFVDIFSEKGIALAKHEKTIKIGKGNFEMQELSVDHGYVVLSEKDQLRANKESSVRRRLLSVSSSQALWKGGFIKPLEGRISSTFGAQRVFNGQLKSMHSGIDIARPTGTPIMASGAGKVILVNNFFYAGNCIYIDHGHGIFTSYFHLSDFSVKEGDWVEKGQKIGLVGATGRVTGPHLHWSANLWGKTINPDRLLDLSPLFVDTAKP